MILWYIKYVDFRLTCFDPDQRTRGELYSEGEKKRDSTERAILTPEQCQTWWNTAGTQT